jgi:hypothetical protein
MTDKEYFLCLEKLVCANKEKTKGFLMTPMFKSGITPDGIRIKSVGLGSCNEDDELIILFDDNTKVVAKSFYGFNCDGNSAFDFTEEDYKMMSTKNINSIRLTNKRSHMYLTYTLRPTEINFLIRVYSHNKIEEINCSN